MSESPVCQKHISFPDAINSVDSMEMGNLPRVILQLRSFSAQVHSLIQSHDGTLPLVRWPANCSTCWTYDGLFVFFRCSTFCQLLHVKIYLW